MLLSRTELNMNSTDCELMPLYPFKCCLWVP